MDGESKTLSSVGLTLDIIEELKLRSGARVTELAEALDRPKATIYYHLNTLLEKQFVRKDDSGVYHLAFRFVELAHFAQERIGSLDSIREQVDALADDSGEISLFSVPEHWYTVCLHVARGEKAVEIPMFVGRRHPLHTTAVGKVLLAHLPERQTKEVIQNHGLDQLTGQTITEPEILLQELESIRERGVAYNRGENLPGLVGVGVPVLDQESNLVGGISIIGPEGRIDDEQLNEDYPRLLKEHANVIKLGFTQSPRYSWEGVSRDERSNPDNRS